jgi:WD40 repeat protein
MYYRTEQWARPQDRVRCSLAVQVLETHKDEVWHVQFSNSGLLLASASKDNTAQIWRIGPTGEAVHMHTLTGHEKAVAFLTWSPDDSRLLTCGSDHEVTPQK